MYLNPLAATLHRRRTSLPFGKGKQRLREELPEELARHGKTRPDHSSYYRPTHRRRE